MYGTVPTVWYSTYSMYGTVPTGWYSTNIVYVTEPTVWHSTNSVVQYQQYGTVPTVWYSTNIMVQYQQYDAVPTVWYSTNKGVIQTLTVAMNQAKQGCPRMPLWGLGVKACNKTFAQFGMESNPGLHGQRRVTNCLNHGIE